MCPARELTAFSIVGNYLLLAIGLGLFGFSFFLFHYMPWCCVSSEILMITCAESDGGIESLEAKTDKWIYHKNRPLLILIMGSNWER